jgi:ATP-binding cassette subfamily C protein CydC
MKTLRRLLELAVPLAGWMALAAWAGLASVASRVGLLATSAFIIASAARHPSIADLHVAIVGVRFFGLARGLARYAERYISHQVTFRLLARLRIWFYQALEPLAPARLLYHPSGDLLARAVADIETLEHFYVGVIAPPVVAALVGLLLVAVMSWLDLRLAGALSSLFLLAGAGLPALMHALSRRSGRGMIEVRAGLNATLVDGIQGMADLIAFGQQAALLERVQSLGRELAAWQDRQAWLAGIQAALGDGLVSLAILAVLGAAIPLITAGQLDGVYLAGLVLAVIASLPSTIRPGVRPRARRRRPS